VCGAPQAYPYSQLQINLSASHIRVDSLKKSSFLLVYSKEEMIEISLPLKKSFKINFSYYLIENR